MSDKEHSSMDISLDEKLCVLLSMAEEYIHHVEGKFVFKYVLYTTHDRAYYNPNLYCYDFMLPNNMKLSIITDNYEHLEYKVFHNYKKIAIPKIQERTIQIVFEYLALVVEYTLDNILDSTVILLDKELNMLEDKEKLPKNDSNDLDGQLLLDLEFEEEFR